MELSIFKLWRRAINSSLTPLFQVEARSGEARAGRIRTSRGTIETPVFMPVGTRATVKCLSAGDLEQLGASVILGNAYHLNLRPGADLIERVSGGLHGFMAWKGALLTDSGGFQVHSLSGRRGEEGVRFQSPWDGSSHLLTPEKSMQIQRALGGDLVMAFDDCQGLPAARGQVRESMLLTLRWARRCLEIPLKKHQHLFGILQGGLELDLRLECLERLEELNFSGLAVGGLSVGEKNDEMVALCRQLAPKMPEAKPRYLMGVGKPTDILEAVRSGLDMFDCVLPTRNARNGQFLTSRGPLNIKKERFREDPLPPDPDCGCRVCQTYSRAYLHHLHRVGEYLAGQSASYHNVHFYLRMMEKARRAIVSGGFDEFYSRACDSYLSGEWV